MNEKTLKCILDAIPAPVVFVDTDHVIRFLNRKAEFHYYKERGYQDLIGKSIFGCHNEKSKEAILNIFEKFKKNGAEVFLKVNARNERVYMTPVRDDSGELIGYFERFENNVQK